jgi:hypothetical protein
MQRDSDNLARREEDRKQVRCGGDGGGGGGGGGDGGNDGGGDGGGGGGGDESSLVTALLFLHRSWPSCRRKPIDSQLRRCILIFKTEPSTPSNSGHQVQQLGVMEELKQQMLQRQQQAEQLTVELRTARGERYVILNVITVLR